MTESHEHSEHESHEHSEHSETESHIEHSAHSENEHSHFAHSGEAHFAAALLAGACIAAVAGALGCFVIWRRMAYFGDAIAHSALLGVAFALAAKIPLTAGIVIICVGLAALLAWMRHKRVAEIDALLGIFAHISVAVGVLALYIAGREADLHAYLLGDIMFLETADLLWVAAVAIAAVIFLAMRWQELLLTTISEEIAAAEQIHPLRINMPLMMLAAFLTATSARIIGVLLIASLLILPAATARRFARTPGGMVAGAMAAGIAAVFAGIGVFAYYGFPATPAIVAAAGLFFILSLIAKPRVD